MAAIAHPSPRRSHARPEHADRPDLRVIQGGRPARGLPSRAVRIRRRRLVALVAVLLVALLAIGAVRLVAGVLGTDAAPAAPSAAALVQPPASVYVVQPGDTLWSIARRVAPGSDPRAVVDRLSARNGGPGLVVGQQLTLDGVMAQ